MALYTIPPGHAFVDALAQGLLERAGGDPLALAAMLVLLPTRRACRSLREAFLRISEGRPMLLPRMMPLGELDEDELVLGGDATGDALDLPPALSGLKRQILLARLVMAMGGGRGGQDPTPDQAALLAAELARLLDQVQTEGLSFERLAALVPETYADHWQITLDFLKILTASWPEILEEMGALDSAERRNLVLRAQAETWRKAPPASPVIAAGSTGSIPATADLLATIAGLAQGCVVLPGLDTDLDEPSWQELDPAHPQYGLKKLLERIGADRAAVADWTGRGAPNPARNRLVSETMRPAATTEAWRSLPRLPGEALSGLSRIDCANPREEAGTIALIMREALQQEGATCALVTLDRSLARRVSSELERWGIGLDDSAGRPLAATPPGAFLRLLVRMMAEECAPLPLLALLKHPLAAGGDQETRFRSQVRLLERMVLRGPRPEAGIDGLLHALPEKAQRLRPWLTSLKGLLAPFATLMAEPKADLRALVRAHMECAEALAATDREAGAARLWKGEAGEVAARFAAELEEAAGPLGEIAPSRYPALLDALMGGQMVRPLFGGHPRLHVWGPLEARLQHADTLILGGLNEGTWPPEIQVDPWMSRPMREAFGLEPPERRHGLSAHDFAQALCAPKIVLTRAVKVDGVQTVPSRWLLRLDAVLDASGLLEDEQRRASWDHPPWPHWHEGMDRPAAVRAARAPEPRPPLAARPRRLSVTEIETWMRDPYAIYAKHVLGLRALDPLDADPGAADYGSLVHDSLEHFLRDNPDRLGADALERLLAAGRATFEEALAAPGIWAFWWPRFESVARWVIARETERRPRIVSISAEISGALELEGPGGKFLLTAKADRIDRTAEGKLEILDYKTGQPPGPKEVKAGFAPQLPLEAAMARLGGFKDLAAAPVDALIYWRLKGGEDGGEERAAGDDPAALADAALAGLQALIDTFDDERTPYQARPHPDKAPKYSDYLHLARVKEWATAGEDGDE
jgi:ATP-dependent helicase/nuclease subunit B